MANLEIFVLILGDSPASKKMFSIIAHDDSTVSTWRKLVYTEKQNHLKGYDAADLRLWKLEQAIPLASVDEKMGDLGSIADEMLPARKLSHYFPSTPTEESLHVIAVLPSLPSAGEKHRRPSKDDADGEPASKRRRGRDSGSKVSQMLPESGTSSSDSEAPPDNKKQKVQYKPRLSDLADGLYSRSETVETLYKRLESHKFIFVRGTPASGKSSLAMLLLKHIREKHPEKDPCFLSRYRDEPDQKPIMGWEDWLQDQGWNSPSNGVLILDEAQLSYWDDAFWLTFIKSIIPSTPYMVILFASYGSAGRNLLNKSTPLVVQEGQLVGLARGPTEPSVGLLLTKKEMEGVVEKHFPNHHFDATLVEFVHSLTSGHVGACYDALMVVHKDQSYRGNNKPYTYADFALNFEMSIFLKKLGDHGVFSRGLPMRDDLEDPTKPFVGSLRKVLNAPSCSVLLDKEQDQRNSKHPLRLCLEQGWLFSEPAGVKVQYRFASQLHQLYTRWLLLRSEDPIKEPDLQTFVIEVIRRFSPQNLQTREDLGTTPQSIPEAQFQQEFYCACCLYTGGCVTTFPECGTPKGRIDFFIRSKKWGVEILREGDRLHGHNSRFITGEYGTWLGHGDMEDYIMIDFRSKKPNHATSDIKKLIYVVSTNNWESLEIYNNKLENIQSFNLLYHDP